MNSRLRKRHQGMLLGLALLLPVGIGLALSSRPSYPTGTQSTADSSLAAPAGQGLDISSRWNSASLRSWLWPAADGEERELGLLSTEGLALPDVLLYWSPVSAESDALDKRAHLLGSFFGTGTMRYRLPAEASGGSLVLYSLAHAEVVQRASLEGLGD
ncbi:MAG: hypothetical protein ACI8QC_001999 [Planctomycetota bacterium]|jgi:hypothetical protein